MRHLYLGGIERYRQGPQGVPEGGATLPARYLLIRPIDRVAVGRLIIKGRDLNCLTWSLLIRPSGQHSRPVIMIPHTYGNIPT